jgi:hypothetical protein
MIKKVFLLSALIASLIAFGSCSTQKQVACPPIKQSKQLARETNKAAKQRKQTESVYHASKSKNNTANKYYKSRNSKVTKPEIRARESVTELTFVSSNKGFVDFETNVKKNLVASSISNQNYNKSNEITKITRLNEKYISSSEVALS